MNSHIDMLQYVILCAVSAQLSSCAGGAGTGTINDDTLSAAADSVKIEHISEINPLHAILIDAYPDYFRDSRLSNDTLFLSDGTSLVFDDRRQKDFVQLLDEGDVEDMFAMEYARNGKPGYLMDAGRSRCEPMFKMMYGKNESEVRKNLVKVNWFGQSLLFNKNNGAADSLRQVMAEIGRHPELNKYTKSAGTFYWRPVRGAKRLSAHSYGIAIDLSINNSNYWLWDHPKASETDSIPYRNRMPLEMVEIFERHGFIWGGRWYHYDTMHFEFRPEILKGHELAVKK